MVHLHLIKLKLIVFWLLTNMKCFVNYLLGNCLFLFITFGTDFYKDL